MQREASGAPGGTIRLATGADAEDVRAIYAPLVRDTFISFELHAPDADEVRRRIKAAAAKEMPWLVYEAEGRALGYAYASPYRARPAYCWSVECSVYVHPSAARVGIGRALYRSLIAVLALQGYRSVFAGIALPNPASVALHLAVGFREVGVFHRAGYKHGAWRDVLWCELSLAADDAPPAEPLTLDAARGQPGWTAALAAGLAPRA
jgi:L-amino acid N-acyltransferase YncA